MKCLLHKVCPPSPFPPLPTPLLSTMSDLQIPRSARHEERTLKDRTWVKRKKQDADQIAISQTIQNHKNAIYDLAATVEGLEVRWNDVRGYYSYVTFHLVLLSLSSILPPFLPFHFGQSYSLPLRALLVLATFPAPLVMATLPRFALGIHSLACTDTLDKCIKTRLEVLGIH
jgi:hypothetical protein